MGHVFLAVAATTSRRHIGRGRRNDDGSLGLPPSRECVAVEVDATTLGEGVDACVSKGAGSQCSLGEEWTTMVQPSSQGARKRSKED
jgi:hypothetical protein